MAIPKDYYCEGQLNIWDYLSAGEPKEEVSESEDIICKSEHYQFPEVDPEIQSGKRKPYEYDFCRAKGMLVDFYDDLGVFRVGKITEWDDYYTTVEIDGEEYVGTPHNTKYHDGQLPSLDECMQEIKDRFGLWCWEPILYDISRGYEYEYKWSHSKMNVHESHYAEGVNGGRRFISVDWSSSLEGRSFPCDTLAQVLKLVESSVDRAETLELEYVRRKEDKKHHPKG